jgi:hypothetical protein
VRPLFEDIVGVDVTLLETGPAVAHEVRRVLGTHGLLTQGPARGGERYWTSGDVRTARHIISLVPASLSTWRASPKRSSCPGRSRHQDRASASEQITDLPESEGLVRVGAALLRTPFHHHPKRRAEPERRSLQVEQPPVAVGMSSFSS